MINRIREVINESPMTKTQIAAAVGVTPAYISYIFKEDCKPRKAFCENLCRVCRINKEWLYTGAGNREDDNDDYLIDNVTDMVHDTFKRKVILFLTELKPNEWETLAALTDRIKK